MNGEVWHEPTPLRVLGTGHALPGDPIPTATLLERIESRFSLQIGRRAEAVARRLGIETRHLSRKVAGALEPPEPGCGNADLAAAALRAALTDAGVRTNEIGYLIAHTATPGRLLPANVARVAGLIGYTGPFVEFRQACTGFANALAFAHGLLRGGGGRPVAIVGSETGSLLFDPRRVARAEDQLVNMLQMGDAAAAVVLAAHAGDRGALLDRAFAGQGGCELRSRAPGLSIPDGGSDAPHCPAGFPEFAHDFAAVRESGPPLLQAAIAAARLGGAADADILVPHQANGRIAAVVAPLAGVAPERVLVNADRVGNTGSAAMWLALAQARRGEARLGPSRLGEPMAPARLRPGERLAALGVEATCYLIGGFRYSHG